MKKTHKKIEFTGGESLESAVKELSRYKENGELAYGEFNGEKLYSDTDDMDSAYLKVTGKTKAECDEAARKRNDEYEKEKREHEEAIPELTKEFVGRGKNILDEKYHELWVKCVPIRLGDLYRGMELGATLEIVKELNSGCGLDVAKEIIEKQGHSGMSFGLVCSMVRSFCDRGVEFVSYVK